MACLLAVTRQSVGRSLKNLVNLGAISLRYAQITIRNRDLLESLIMEKVDRTLSVGGNP